MAAWSKSSRTAARDRSSRHQPPSHPGQWLGRPAPFLRSRATRAELSMYFIEAKGCRIPAVGLGTWRLNGRECVRIVEQAIRLGYRHFDTAQMYGNEREVGEGVRASGIKRE